MKWSGPLTGLRIEQYAYFWVTEHNDIDNPTFSLSTFVEEPTIVKVCLIMVHGIDFSRRVLETLPSLPEAEALMQQMYADPECFFMEQAL